ncbi:MAG: hypothetical protein JO036_06290 [Candidatus Eremiobacteraeota bacterium]|nr:hypothetical protein [Candidatus Eremiobacteraeota bacterium]
MVVAIALLLIFPPTRRALRTLYEQIIGYRDGFFLSSHQLRSAEHAVTSKVDGFQHSVVRWCRKKMIKYHEETRKRYLGYTVALREHKDAAEALVRIEDQAKRDRSNGIFETSVSSRSPFSEKTYYTLQAIIGVGDIVFTYFAFELFALPTILLVPLVLMLGGIGVVLGHFCGQAIKNGNRPIAIATGIGCVGQSLILGATRFAYLLSQAQVSNVDTISAIAAFGIPFLLVFTSVILGAQLRYPTALELARARESAAQHLCDATFAGGRIAAEKLNARMEERKWRTLEIIDAYYRGFHFGWRNEPLEFDDPQIKIPAAEWPPPAVAPETTPPAAATASGMSRGGSP